MTPADLEPYRVAIGERICAFCIDRLPGGACGRTDTGERCALQEHLGAIVDAILGVGGSPRIEDYVRALRAQACPHCRQDERGFCPLRDVAECAANAYFLPIVEVVEEVAEAESRRRAT